MVASVCLSACSSNRDNEIGNFCNVLEEREPNVFVIDSVANHAKPCTDVIRFWCACDVPCRCTTRLSNESPGLSFLFDYDEIENFKAATTADVMMLHASLY